jgi:hypothetical protein
MRIQCSLIYQPLQSSVLADCSVRYLGAKSRHERIVA